MRALLVVQSPLLQPGLGGRSGLSSSQGLWQGGRRAGALPARFSCFFPSLGPCPSTWPFPGGDTWKTLGKAPSSQILTFLCWRVKPLSPGLTRAGAPCRHPHTWGLYSLTPRPLHLKDTHSCITSVSGRNILQPASSYIHKYMHTRTQAYKISLYSTWKLPTLPVKTGGKGGWVHQERGMVGGD